MNILLRIFTHPTTILGILLVSVGYFSARILPGMKATERNSWRQICDSSSLRMVGSSYCYTCQGSSHTFIDPLFAGESK